MNYNISELIFEAESSNIKKITASSSAYSFGIINADGNSKRISVSKALAKKLEITDKMQIVPLVHSNVILVAKQLSIANASECTLKGNDKKIGYNASLVKYLTTVFNLDFSGRTSMSFNDISFDEHEGLPIAVISVTAPADDNGESND